MQHAVHKAKDYNCMFNRMFKRRRIILLQKCKKGPKIPPQECYSIYVNPLWEIALVQNCELGEDPNS